MHVRNDESKVTLPAMPVQRKRMEVRSMDRWNRPQGVAVLVLGIVVVALACRLALAHKPGYEFDVGVNQEWAYSAVRLGIAESYRQQLNGNMLPNYPPLSIMVFAGTGYVYNYVFSPTYDLWALAYRYAIKFPAILADAAIAVSLFFIFRRYKGIWWGLAAGLIFAVHPASIHTSAVWGQTDSWYTLAMVLAVYAAARNKWILCGALTAASLLLKVHAIMMLPLIGLLVIQNNRRIGGFILGATAVTCAVLLPFALDGDPWAPLKVYTEAVGAYPQLAVGANNFWSAFYGPASGGLDTDLFMGWITYRSVGLLLFAAAALAVIVVMRQWITNARENSRVRPLMLLLTAGLLAHAFFIFNTEIHERYLYSYLAFALPLLVTGGMGITLYASVSLVLLFNLLAVLPFSAFDEAIALEFPALNIFMGSAQIFLFICTLVHVAHWQPKRPAAEEEMTLWKKLRRLLAAPIPRFLR